MGWYAPKELDTDRNCKRWQFIGNYGWFTSPFDALPLDCAEVVDGLGRSTILGILTVRWLKVEISTFSRRAPAMSFRLATIL